MMIAVSNKIVQRARQLSLKYLHPYYHMCYSSRLFIEYATLYQYAKKTDRLSIIIENQKHLKVKSHKNSTEIDIFSFIDLSKNNAVE